MTLVQILGQMRIFPELIRDIQPQILGQKCVFMKTFNMIINSDACNTMYIHVTFKIIWKPDFSVNTFSVVQLKCKLILTILKCIVPFS